MICFAPPHVLVSVQSLQAAILRRLQTAQDDLHMGLNLIALFLWLQSFVRGSRRTERCIAQVIGLQF